MDLSILLVGNCWPCKLLQEDSIEVSEFVALDWGTVFAAGTEEVGSIVEVGNTVEVDNIAEAVGSDILFSIIQQYCIICSFTFKYQP